ncbi:4Fe-4S dicluster domain-containing protein [Desulfocurvus vexinensis]|uniref:4Fe-4S dicluster domain-containing protein n=1 Tax=Desulfocurvus vexinensis TaxID=399548 RepID=UPI0004BB56A7|nr:4Fe-4S dicluster domain-containing protein [Desulfocurvus vexinensis]
MTRIPVIQAADPALAQAMGEVRAMLAACMQCGTCSASCPNAQSMDMTPRRMWRLVLMGRADAVFSSGAFWMCSNCYACTLRCPRGLPLTSAMNALKRIAGASGHPALARHGAFYRAFLDNVRRRGRVRETEMMMHYFSAAGPGEALRFTPLGLRLMRRGKVRLELGSGPWDGALAPLFERAARLEGKEARQ